MNCETTIEPQWTEVWGTELYDHKGDEANDFGVSCCDLLPATCCDFAAFFCFVLLLCGMFLGHSSYLHGAGAYETENLAYRPEYADVVAQLKEELHEHWPTA